MNLKFTVVTVVFNGESVIEKTVESVLNQEYPPFEYLIFDGGSTDSTLNLIGQVKEAFARKGITQKANTAFDAQPKRDGHL